MRALKAHRYAAWMSSGAKSIPPTFGPRSGWLQAGQWAPSSQMERAAMLEAAVPCCVVVLYRLGQRIPARELLKAEPPAGWLLCMDRYTKPDWHACLFRDETMTSEAIPRLMHARLERENGGVRLYGGIIIDRHREGRQAWLCAPSRARAREILLAMLESEGG